MPSSENVVMSCKKSCNTFTTFTIIYCGNKRAFKTNTEMY